MSVTTAPDVIESLKWRYATKKFDAQAKIDQPTWARIEEALTLTPSSFGLQPWKFVVITDQKIKDQLPPLSWNQQQPSGCSHLLIISRLDEIDASYIDKHISQVAKQRKVPTDAAGEAKQAEALAQYKQMMLDFIQSATKEELADWMSRQCYIALGNVLTVAALYGVDACPMEGFDKDAYDKLLGLPDKGCRSQVVCALGYRAKDDKYADLAKVRFAESDLFIRY
jgi:nitroreductase